MRVVNSTVTSSRTGAVAGLLPVQTYNGSTTRVGGEAPEKNDAGAGTTNTTLASLNTATTIAESQATVTVAVGSTAVGADFGYNFDTVVNTNDTGQGSLRQFILNSNALGSESTLAQLYTTTSGATTALATGVETSIFMIPDGTAGDGQLAGLTSGFSTPNNGSGTAATITLASALPNITGPGTAIDGSTQTRSTGDNNLPVATAGFESTGPEVLININNQGALNIAAANDRVIGMGIYGSNGTTGVGLGITNNATGAIVQNSTINNNGANISFTSSNTASAATIASNVIRDSQRGNADGIELNGGNSNMTISNNQILRNAGFGIDFIGGANTNNTISGNIISGNGTSTGTSQLSGIGLRSAGSNNNTISGNTITNNNGAGIVAKIGTTGNIFSQNTFGGNGAGRPATAGTGLAIDLMAANITTDADNGDGVTINDLNDLDAPVATTTSGANGLINFPILQRVLLNADNTLTITGFARPGVLVELYTATDDPTHFGEGSRYLTSFTQVTTGTATAYGTVATGTTINGLNQGTDATLPFTLTYTPTAAQLTLLRANGTLLTSTSTLTATTAGNFGTSEFSGNARVLTPPVPNDVTNATIPSNTVTAVVLNPNVSATANGFTGDVTTNTTNTIASYTVNPVTNGTLFLNGTAITAATTVAAANIGQLTFRPTFGFVGNAVFTYTAIDANGTASTTHNTNGTVTTGPATYTIPVAAAADLTTALTGPQTVSPGQPTGTYTATFTNEGPQAATTVAQTVTLPTGATNVFRNGIAYNATGGVIDFGTAANLAAGTSNAFTFSFTPATTATGTVAITSNVSTTGLSQGANAAPDASTITATVAAVADIAATITVNTPSRIAGSVGATGTPNFTVNIVNNGPSTAENVTASVQLPAGLTNVNATNGGTYNATTGIVTYQSVGSVTSGTTLTSVITFTAPATGPVTAGVIASTSTNEAGRTANNSATGVINITPAFDLTTTLTGPTSAVETDLVTLAVTTTNNGISPAANAVQTVQLVAGLTNVYVSNGGVYNRTATAQNITANGMTYNNVQPGQVVFPTVANLPAGQTVTNSVSFAQPATAFSPSALVTPNTLPTATTSGDTNPNNNTAFLNQAASSTSLAKLTSTGGIANEYTTIAASVASTTVGSPITLTVVTGNKGPNQATGVTQRVQLLPGLATAGLQVNGSSVITTSGNVISFTAAAANGASYDNATGVLTFGTLTNGTNGSTSATSVSNTITFNAPASTGNNGQLLAMAAVSTTNTDPVPADNVASVGVTLIPTADLATAISGPATATAGQQVTYTATFTNNGPMALSGFNLNNAQTGNTNTQTSGVTQTAQLPTGLSNVTITDATGAVVTNAAYSAATGQVTFPFLTTYPAGATQVFNLSFTAPSQPLVVRSSVTTVGPDAVATNNSASATTTIAAAADLATTVAGPATAVIGSAVTYSVSTTNNGPSTAVNTVATLQLAQGLTTVSVPNGSYNSGTGLVTFNTLASLASGATTSNYVTFVMPNAAGGQTTGVASATSATADPTSNNNTASVATSIAPTTTNLADITATVSVTSATGPVAPGSTISLLATYGNTGPAAATNVVPTLQLIPGLTNATLTIQGATSTTSGNAITFSNGAVYNTQTGVVTFSTIASQTSNQSYTINVTAPSDGPLVATAVTTSNTSEPATSAAQANNLQSVSVGITPLFDEVTRLSGPATALIGSSQTYTVTTLNNGPSLTSNATTQTVTLPSGVTATGITNGGQQVGTTITWTIPAGQAPGANGAVANSFTITQPTGGATLAANVTVTGESNTGNNTAYLNGAAAATATTVPNQVPVAIAVVNSTAQNPLANTANAPMAISPLLYADQDGLQNINFIQINSIPAAQGTLYYNAASGYTALPTGTSSITLAQAMTLRFLPAADFVGNATTTFRVIDKNDNRSAYVNYTIPVEPSIEAAVYEKTPVKGGNNGIYVKDDVIAYTIDVNGATYNATTASVYTTLGILQPNAANGVVSAVTGAFTSSRTDVTSLAALGLVVDANGRIVVSDPGTPAAPKLRTGTYSIVITTTDANGGVSTQTVAFVIPAAPLPVVLTALTAQAVQNRDALLTWTTASEVNSAYFDVERSLDGMSYTKIGQVAAKGNSTTSSNYTFTDASVAARANGAVYYRLHQVDRDATASYSPVRTVSFTKVAAVALSLYPNPAQNATTLDVSALPATGTYQVLVLDATGRAVRTVSVGGGQLQTLNLTDLASGTYQVLVTGTLANGDALRQVIRLTKE